MRVMQENQVDKGRLQVVVQSAIGSRPIERAEVSIFYTGEPDRQLEKIQTDRSGNSPTLELSAPPVEYSLEPGEYQPYSEYTLHVEAPGFEPVDINGTEILSGVTALQPVKMQPTQESEDFERIVIPAHTLFAEYPPKIPEEEIKPVNESGEIVLSKVVVPEFIVVHDGPIQDTQVENYYVRYKDYIKNVACSEIYATWPDSTIRANVLAIMSFTLNRVYTEWYRNKGYDFTITSSTAYDHKWIHGRNIFENVAQIVDEQFANYLSRPNVRQPILTQYCDGQRVSCPNWMRQWGSKDLGDQGYSAIEILRYYYGDNMYINTAEEISGIPASWPRYDLDIGASGEKVRQIQEQLNEIAGSYPALPTVTINGIYDEQTKESVRKFQEIFGLPQTGIVDYSTWYKIQEIYVAVTRIAELYP
ncbi:MAG: peptidoglycan-binding protein [Blautia sp.]